MSDIKQELDKIRGRISEPSFLKNEGLSNEVGIHVFCYDPADELIVRDFVSRLKAESGTPYHIKECDLYEIFLRLLEDKRVLKSVTGVGKIFPFMRSHKMLDSMQHLFEDIPIVMFYPGSFNGQDLGLFGKFLDGHYYRAFNLL